MARRGWPRPLEAAFFGLVDRFDALRLRAARTGARSGKRPPARRPEARSASGPAQSAPPVPPRAAAPRPPPQPAGFAEDMPPGLADFDARLPPPGVEPVPAFVPAPSRYVRTERLSPERAAGGGLVAGPDGQKRPHYWGHRERLRTRFLEGGHAPMPDYEVVELLLFNAIPRIDVKPLAKRLLAAFGDLSGLVAAERAQVLAVEGATERVYLQLRIVEAFAQRMARAQVLDRQVMSSWDDIVAYCRLRMACLPRESFRVLFLDRRNVLIADEELGQGTVDHVPVYPREVARRALEVNASAVVLVHNHPSGDPTPSAADIEMTHRIAEACETLGLVLHDHLIVGRAGETSMRADGLI